jgi:hypothetical protein
VIRKLVLVSLSLGCLTALFGAEASAGNHSCPMRRNRGSSSSSGYRQSSWGSSNHYQGQTYRRPEPSTNTQVKQQQSDLPPGLRLSSKQSD